MDTSTNEKEKWRVKIRSVSKERRRNVITDAHDIGKLSHREISLALGDITRQRVVSIVKEVRAERSKA